MNCSDCVHWVVPSWDTGGFGTCYLRSYRRDKKLPPMWRIGGGNQLCSLGTHKDFGCIFFEKKPEPENNDDLPS